VGASARRSRTAYHSAASFVGSSTAVADDDQLVAVDCHQRKYRQPDAVLRRKGFAETSSDFGVSSVAYLLSEANQELKFKR
jgi:hypothetical protein